MRVPAAVLIAAVLLSCTACRTTPAEEEPAVWFVHVTDPHLFYGDEDNEPVRLHQEKLNQDAFSALIQGLGSIPGMESKPSFLLVTGDFGLDRFGATPALPASTTQPVIKAPDQPAPAGGSPAERESAVSLLAETLKASPVKDIYLVLGNNDVAAEAPSGTNLDVAAAFLGDVQKRIAGSGVVLHDLTSCYRDPAHLPSGCSFDVPGTDFRLIGFSSFSFKNVKEAYAANQPVQEAQMQQLATLVNQAGAQGKKVLIVTHIPEIDDPYPLGKFRWRAESPAKSHRPAWAAFSPWNVSPAVYQMWKEIVNSGNVAGVLAGHFHDSHKEIYYRPYRWATSPSERADVRKLFLVPPLSVRLQDTSPIQARGFALFRLREDGVRRNFYWYDPEGRSFKPDTPLPKSPSAPDPFSRVIAWLWQVVLVKVDLARAVVIAIAFLAAFLTAVQLWEVPPHKSSLASPAATPNPQPAPPATGIASSLSSNFVKTVLAGLGGMLALDFLGAIWNLQDINGKAYYVLMFIVFFFLLLLLYAFLQSLVEALRSRIATRRQPPPPDPRFARRHGGSPGGGNPGGPPGGGNPGGPPGGGNPGGPFGGGNPGGPPGGGNPGGPFGDGPPPSKSSSQERKPLQLWQRFSDWTAYWQNRIWRWLLSLRSFALVFSDTFFNVIRGRNQLRTKIFEDTIIDLHRSIVRAADRIREEVDAAILRVLQRQGIQTGSPSDIRVNITILSEEESTVYYISRERGSLSLPFDKHSIAWLSIYTGEARWFKDSYRCYKKKDGENSGDGKESNKERKERDLLLLDNSSQRYPNLPGLKLMLGDYLQARFSPDYKAFMVLPVPLLQRGGEAGSRRGAIQISFREEKYMDRLWKGLDKEDEQGQDVPAFEQWQQLVNPHGRHLHIADEELGAVLHEALEVLAELIRSFNDTVFEEYIKPGLQSV